ncbi:zinc-binding oxidoreductase alcohol dehydrogenase [Scheffersomyces coipomensis]|uniref:zinc-binding oxidoreductase alcohol dehydrogenase n=1 Tax=Scheffersomyces coipomensis TaxID=1788519 RepID=UPI00315D56B2
MSSNKIVLSTGLTGKGELTTISTTVFPQITDNQILLRGVAYAANPTDWKHTVLQWGYSGSIVGSDASGIVTQIGKNVKGFEIGDYVSTTLRGNYSIDKGGFAEYVIADPPTTIKYDKSTFSSEPLPVGSFPASIINTFEGAAAITLSLSTVGLSLSHSLKIKPTKESNSSKYILIWGGATSAGIVAIQIAKSVYGLKVITTASKKHHEFLKSLGADATFDYRDSNVIDQIKVFAQGKIYYALDTVSTIETYQQTYDATAGSPTESYDNLLFLPREAIKTDPENKARFSGTIVYLANGEPQELGTVVYPTQELLDDYNQFWYELLPPFLKDLKTPNLRVLKPGFESANEALELLREDKVSAEKVVFRYQS